MQFIICKFLEHHLIKQLDDKNKNMQTSFSLA